jgi:hypothetical protein
VIHGLLSILGRIPNLNDVLDARATTFTVSSKRLDKYTPLKAKWTKAIEMLARSQIRKPLPPAHYRILFIEPNRKRDPDGLFVAAKFILDGIKEAGLIENDGWKQVLGVEFVWEVSGDDFNPGVLVAIGDSPTELVEAALGLKRTLRAAKQLGLGESRGSLDRLIDKEIKR